MGKTRKNDRNVFFIVSNGIEIKTKKLLKKVYIFIFKEYFKITLFKLYFEE